MIWVAGEIVPDDALRISVLDRTFEHGLGLFETFRTWNGRAILLDQHLQRMVRSAKELGLPLDPCHLPDAAAVEALRQAEGLAGDAVFRLTLSGGLAPLERFPGGPGELRRAGSNRPQSASEAGWNRPYEDRHEQAKTALVGAALWMRAHPLPPEPPPSGVIASVARVHLDMGDRLSRHKTLNYWPRRLAYEQARADGAYEALIQSSGSPIEGSRTSLFTIREGTLLTPSLDWPILPGIMRSLVLERAAALGFPADEIAGSVDGLLGIADGLASEVFLSNSVRGIVPVSRVADAEGRYDHHFSAPGDGTTRLARDVTAWLNRGGMDP